METIGGEDETFSTCYKTYSLKQAKEAMDRQRDAEVAAGLPKRKLSPMSRYILEELIGMYFKDYASKGDTLVKIKIEDTKQYGI